MTFGGKADNLLRLSADFPVPEFFVLAPDELLDNVLQKFDELGAKKVAVRSSALNEDGKDAAWAGQLETILNVERGGLLVAIEHCRQSAHSERATAYAAAHDMVSGGVAVVVQRMLEPTYSGVAFSTHPVTHEHKVVVEAVRGLGEQLVSGQVTPDTYIEGGEVYMVGSEPILGETLLTQVTQLTKDVASKLQYEVDIEWAYENERLYLLQARPITTL